VVTFLALGATFFFVVVFFVAMVCTFYGPEPEPDPAGGESCAAEPPPSSAEIS
jgi:hypothetical protein